MLRTNGNGVVVRFYRNMDFSNVVQESACGTDIFSPVYNLTPGVTYQYKVFDSDNKLITSIYNVNSQYGQFTVTGQIRQLRIDGIRNVRDCGGYVTVDGKKRIKYGKLYRGSQFQPGFYNTGEGYYNVTKDRRWLDGDPSTDVKYGTVITESEIELIKKLGITLDIDLRDYSTTAPYIDGSGNIKKTDRASDFFATPDNNTYGIDDHINYYSISRFTNNTAICCYYSLFSSTNGRKQFKNFINFIIDEFDYNKGGVYVHCQQGRDRTGTFLAFLFALLGINDDGILKDYELTSYFGYDGERFSLQYGTSSSSVNSNPTIPASATDFRDYVKGEMLRLGIVTQEQIDKLKELLLEDVNPVNVNTNVNVPVNNAGTDASISNAHTDVPADIADTSVLNTVHTYQIQNSVITDYLNTHSGSKAYVMSDLKRVAHTPSATEGDYSTWKPNKMTKGLSLSALKNLVDPENGIKNMVEYKGYANYKEPKFIRSDYKNISKPGYYQINDANVNKVVITDTTNDNSFVLQNDTESKTYAATFCGTLLDRYYFDQLPVIGTSTWPHVLDKFKPFLEYFGKGTQLICLNSSYSLSTPPTYAQASTTLKVANTPVIKYDDNIDWSALDMLAKGATVAAPKIYKVVFFDAKNTYKQGFEVYIGPLHKDNPTKIYNLIPGRVYHIDVFDANDNIIRSEYVKPKGQLRMMHFEGVFNVRDLGGWPCFDDNGKQVGKIVYDKLYRGSRPETDTTYYFRAGATVNDRKMMTDFIKLGKEIDLREADKETGTKTTYQYLITKSNTTTTSASSFGLNISGEGKIPRVRFSVASYWPAFDYCGWDDGPSYINPIRQSFNVLGEIISCLYKNQSAYFHCAQGADRTASIAMLVESLVGCKDDTILKDWELTSLSGCVMKNNKSSYTGSISDYRALHNDCVDVLSPNSGTHELIRLIELSDYLEDVYKQGSIAKNIVAWFMQTSKYTNVNPPTSKVTWYMHHVGMKDKYLNDKETTSSSYVKAVLKAPAVATSVANSYLGVINARLKANNITDLSFTKPEEVISFLKNKLID